MNFNMRFLPDLKKTKNLSSAEIKKHEGKKLLKGIAPGDELVLLDEKGKQFNSVEFASFLQKKFNAGLKKMIFCIGGAYGFSEEVYMRSNSKISLSEMTFSHQMVRLIFLEQLYRAFTIIKGEPYHNF